MLELRHISKSYKVGGTLTRALRDVSLTFPDTGFVSILGPSGSGKTTLLNILGGLDRYDSGDLLLEGRSTRNFSTTQWDAYRNNSVGFVFQSYNLIPHLSVTENVELGMRLSGVRRRARRTVALRALSQVGLADQARKRPNQLSGGQMQRVAIARAIATSPAILLCDEPTGALDSVTSVQVMDLIHEFSRNRLVIMVTHNERLAERYSTRIIRLRDGRVLSDTRPLSPIQAGGGDRSLHLRHTRMSYMSAIALSLTNLLSKKGRTFLTALASSIGIISIAVVLSLSGGFQAQIDQTMSRTLGRYPVSISQTAVDQKGASRATSENDALLTRSKNRVSRMHLVAASDPMLQSVHLNRITQKYVDYVRRISPEIASDITLQQAVSLHVLTRVGTRVQPVSFSDAALAAVTSLGSPDSEGGGEAGSSQLSQQAQLSQQTASSNGVASSVFPTPASGGKSAFLRTNYDLLRGRWPSAATDVVLVVDGNDEVPTATLRSLGIAASDGQRVSFSSILGKDYRLATNDQWYTRTPAGLFAPAPVDESLFSRAAIRLRVCGVIQPKPRGAMELLSPGIAYSNSLTDRVLRAERKSRIVQAQEASPRNVLTGRPLSGREKAQTLATLGGSSSYVGKRCHSVHRPSPPWGAARCRSRFSSTRRTSGARTGFSPTWTRGTGARGGRTGSSTRTCRVSSPT